MRGFVPVLVGIALACLPAATGSLAQDDPTFEAAKRLFQAREYQAAAEKCGQIVETYPEYPWGWHCIGIGRWDRGELDKAENALRTALALQPDSFESQYALGRVLFDRKEYGGAASQWESAAAAAAGPQQFRAASNALADARFRAGEYDEARSLLEAAVESDPDAFRPRYMLGLTCRRLDDLECAVEQLRAARDLQPGHADLPRIVAELSAHAAETLSPETTAGGRFDQAILDAEAWVDAQPGDAGARVHLVDLLLRAERFEEAAQRAERFASEEPGACRILVGAARAHNRLGDPGAARDWSLKAVECDPASADAWNENARACLDEARALIATGTLLDDEDRIDAMLSDAREALERGRAVQEDGSAARMAEEASEVEAAYRAALDGLRLVADNEYRCRELRVKWWNFRRDDGPPLTADERSFLRGTCGEELR